MEWKSEKSLRWKYFYWIFYNDDKWYSSDLRLRWNLSGERYGTIRTSNKKITEKNYILLDRYKMYQSKLDYLLFYLLNWNYKKKGYL